MIPASDLDLLTWLGAARPCESRPEIAWSKQPYAVIEIAELVPTESWRELTWDRGDELPHVVWKDGVFHLVRGHRRVAEAIKNRQVRVMVRLLLVA